MPDIGGKDEAGSRTPEVESFSVYSKPKILCFLTQCVVGICECVIGFCEIAACSRIFGQNTKSLIILLTAAGENRFFVGGYMLLYICCSL